jgi:hypothetical protein
LRHWKSAFPQQHCPPQATRPLEKPCTGLSTEELILLSDVVANHRQGKLDRDLTEGEAAAIQVYSSAVQQEVQLAGFRSMAEFEQKYLRR